MYLHQKNYTFKNTVSLSRAESQGQRHPKSCRRSYQPCLVSLEPRLALEVVLGLQASKGGNPMSKPHSWRGKVRGLGGGYSHKGWSGGHWMTLSGLPGSLLSCNQLRCQSQTPQGTNISGGVGWGVVQGAVPLGAGAGSWHLGWYTQSW